MDETERYPVRGKRQKQADKYHMFSSHMCKFINLKQRKKKDNLKLEKELLGTGKEAGEGVVKDGWIDVINSQCMCMKISQ